MIKQKTAYEILAWLEFRRGLFRSSRRGISSPAELDRTGLPQPHLLQRRRQGWSLRGVGGAATVLRGSPSGVQIAALVGVRRVARTSSAPPPTWPPGTIASSA